MIAEDSTGQEHVAKTPLQSASVHESQRKVGRHGHHSRSPINAAYARYEAAAIVADRPVAEGSHSVNTASAYGLRSGRYTSPASCAMVEISPVLWATFAP